MAYCPNKGLVYLDNLAGFPATDVETVTAGNALHAWWATEVSNNVRHLIDAAGQHRVNSVALGTTPVGRQHSFTANNTWEHLTSFGPFPWFVRPDEQLYRPVVRLGASVSNAAYTLDLRVALTGSDSPLSADLYLDKVEFTTSSTTNAWLAPTGGDPNYLSPTPELAYLDLIQQLPTKSTSLGSNPQARQVLLRLDVWAKIDNVLGTANLAGLHLRECVGET